MFDGLPRREGEDILLVQYSRVPLEFFALDRNYVERLRDADRSTEHHFVAYFEQREGPDAGIGQGRRPAPGDVHTGHRRVAARRRCAAARALARSLTPFVTTSYWNTIDLPPRASRWHMDTPDKVLDLEGMLVTKQVAERVRQILEEMPAKGKGPEVAAGYLPGRKGQRSRMPRIRSGSRLPKGLAPQGQR
jgi:hypothetical protein